MEMKEKKEKEKEKRGMGRYVILASTRLSGSPFHPVPEQASPPQAPSVYLNEGSDEFPTAPGNTTGAEVELLHVAGMLQRATYH